ncbi:MAG: hypothetical protein ACK4S4_13250 [Pyrinomonadaceae bacterium]
MKAKARTFFAAIACTLVFAALAAAQSSTFSDPSVEYSFDLPDPGWKMTVKPSATSPNVEYVYNDRRDGRLEVRKLSVPKDAILADVIQEEETKLRFNPGYVRGKEENFAGNYRGTVFNYEYVASGRNMSGRFYFLKTPDGSIYVLRFTGERDKLKSIRNFTDSIARTFRVR